MRQVAHLFKHVRILPSNLIASQVGGPPVRQLASCLVAHEQARTNDFSGFVHSGTFPAVQHMPACRGTLYQTKRSTLATM